MLVANASSWWSLLATEAISRRRVARSFINYKRNTNSDLRDFMTKENEIPQALAWLACALWFAFGLAIGLFL